MSRQQEDDSRSSMNPLRLGILGSGKGSNFRAILQAIQDGRLNAGVALVCSDVPDAGILQLARTAGLEHANHRGTQLQDATFDPV